MAYTIENLILSIIIGTTLMLGLIGILVWIKSIKNNFKKIQNEIKIISDNTRKEFERIRFAEKPICKVGDVYNNRFVVTKAKYCEYPSYSSSQQQSLFLLNICYEYELFDLQAKSTIPFNYSLSLEKFIKDNNLKLTKIGK